jgi:hypothetical protein
MPACVTRPSVMSIHIADASPTLWTVVAVSLQLIRGCPTHCMSGGVANAPKRSAESMLISTAR